MESLFFEAIESEDLPGQLLRSLRQGMFFGIETRVPYAITSIIRPYLFGQQTRPLLSSFKFFSEQTFSHGWIIARIAFLYKLTEQALMRTTGKGKPEEWHSFFAGCLAGYLIMVKENKNNGLKKQINMAIGIRTIYALGSYLVRTNQIPCIDNTKAGYERGTNIFYTLLWGVVMWHWRHQTNIAPGEMNPAQVNQMNFIYNGGDIPGKEKWFKNYFLFWAALLIGFQQL